MHKWFRVLAVACLIGMGMACGRISRVIENQRGPSGPPEQPRVTEQAGQLDSNWKKRVKPVSFTTQGRERTAAVHVPKDYDPSKRWPLVLMFHGGKDSSGKAVAPHWKHVLDQDFLVVFPNGQRENPTVPSWKVDDPNDLSDVGLVRDLVAQIQQHYAVDESRIYAAGFSNGGMQTMMLACHASDLFRGVAVVHQTLHHHLAATCTPDRALPMLYVNGTADEHWRGRDFSLSALDTIEWWAAHHGCDASKIEKTRVQDKAADGTTVEHWRYASCSRAPLEFFRIENGGHSWPGSDYKGSNHCMDIHATDEVLNFWRSHADFGSGAR